MVDPSYGHNDLFKQFPVVYHLPCFVYFVNTNNTLLNQCILMSTRYYFFINKFIEIEELSQKIG